MSRIAAPGRRGDDGDARGEAGQRALARLVEEALGREAPLALLEHREDVALAGALEPLDDHLVLAPRRVDGDGAARSHEHAVRGLEAEAPWRGSGT